jgi:hypothetical protein
MKRIFQFICKLYTPVKKIRLVGKVHKQMFVV